MKENWGQPPLWCVSNPKGNLISTFKHRFIPVELYRSVINTYLEIRYLLQATKITESKIQVVFTRNTPNRYKKISDYRGLGGKWLQAILTCREVFDTSCDFPTPEVDMYPSLSGNRRPGVEWTLY